DNTNAWFSGFVPQLETTVWMGYEPRDDGHGQMRIPPLRHLHGVREVTGGTLPARIWHDYMTVALQGVAAQDFPPPSFGGATPSGTPTPTASPTPSPTPSRTPSVPVTVPVTTPPTGGLPSIFPTSPSSSGSASPTASPTSKGAP